MMLFPRKLKNEIHKKNSVRLLNASGGYSYLFNDGIVHLLIESQAGTPSVIACSRSLSSVAFGDAVVFSLFISRVPQCKQCLDHFYASQLGKERDARLSKVINQQTRKFNDDQLSAVLLAKASIAIAKSKKMNSSNR